MNNLIPQHLFEMSKVSSEEYRDIIYNFYKYCDDNFYEDIDKIDPNIFQEVSFTWYRQFTANKPKTLYETLTEHPFLDVKIKFDIIYKTDKSDIRTYCEMIIRNSMFYFDDEDENKTSIYRLKDMRKYYDIMFNKIKEQING